MADDQIIEDFAGDRASVHDVLDHARTLLAAEGERAVALRKQVPVQLGLAWAWFAFVQVGLLIIVSATSSSDGYNESSDWSTSTIAMIVAVFAAAVIVALTAAAARFWAIDDGAPSGFDAGGLDSAPAFGADIVTFTSQSFHDLRIANARRAGRLSTVRSAWVASMTFTLAELVMIVATLAAGI